MSKELFLRLTPDWVLRAVEAGGYEPTGHVLALNSLENRVYDFLLEDGRHIVAKFYRPERWTRAAIQDEHDFLSELRAADVPVAAPVAFADGSTLHDVEGIVYAVWDRVGGRAPEEVTDEQAEILGRLLARMHNVGATRPAKHRRVLDSETYVREPLAHMLQRNVIPAEWSSRYEKAALEVARAFDSRSRNVPRHRIHGDCHPGNLLDGKSGYFFLDFDDFLAGPAVQDVWMLIPSADEAGQRQREVLIEGYRQFRPFSSSWLGLVEPLRALRWIHYAAWIARRWNDPAFPRAFPNWGTAAYWEREVRDLEQKVAGGL